MIGVPFIKSLFSAILSKSKVINGRFYICPFWGQELNKGNIEEIVSWVQPHLPSGQKYPAALLMPMKSAGNMQYDGDNSVENAYNTIECTMVFVTNAYVTGQNQVSSPAEGTNQPTHTIPDTWHDMERCAGDFMKVIYNGILAQGLQSTIFISEKRPQELIEVTNKSNDSVSGVLMRFYICLASGCGIEDYPEEYLKEIQWPEVTDTHPLHLDV
jgi:hypothetical protein